MTRRSADLGHGRSASKTRRGHASQRRTVERVQTGVRIERRILLVMKALASAHDITLGDLIEGIVLHAFEGKAAFGSASLTTIKALRAVYKLDLTATDSHSLVERRKP